MRILGVLVAFFLLFSANSSFAGRACKEALRDNSRNFCGKCHLLPATKRDCRNAGLASVSKAKFCFKVIGTIPNAIGGPSIYRLCYAADRSAVRKCDKFSNYINSRKYRRCLRKNM